MFGFTAARRVLHDLQLHEQLLTRNKKVSHGMVANLFLLFLLESYEICNIGVSFHKSKPGLGKGLASTKASKCAINLYLKCLLISLFSDMQNLNKLHENLSFELECALLKKVRAWAWHTCLMSAWGFLIEYFKCHEFKTAYN